MALRVFFSYGGEPTRFLSSTMEDASHSHSQLDGSLRGSSNLRNGHSLGIISPRSRSINTLAKHFL